jgi:hypothetical protein
MQASAPAFSSSAEPSESVPKLPDVSKLADDLYTCTLVSFAPKSKLSQQQKLRLQQIAADSKFTGCPGSVAPLVDRLALVPSLTVWRSIDSDKACPDLGSEGYPLAPDEVTEAFKRLFLFCVDALDPKSQAAKQFTDITECLRRFDAGYQSHKNLLAQKSAKELADSEEYLKTKGCKSPLARIKRCLFQCLLINFKDSTIFERWLPEAPQEFAAFLNKWSSNASRLSFDLTWELQFERSFFAFVHTGLERWHRCAVVPSTEPTYANIYASIFSRVFTTELHSVFMQAILIGTRFFVK